MINITQSQIDKLENLARERFVNKCAPYFRKRMPGRFECDEELNNEIYKGLEIAEKLGVEKQGNTKFIIEMVLTHGPEFYCELPFSGAREILYNDELSGDERVKELKQKLMISQIGSLSKWRN